MTKNRDIRVFIGLLVAFIIFTVSLASGATIAVDDSGGADYTSIQVAINNANAGDVIEVQSGVYCENIVVNKKLSLNGIGMPLVNASGTGTAITITSSDSTVDGFNITGSGTDWNGGDADSGIKIKSDNNSILNSIVGFNNYGVYIFESSNNTIKNNNVSNNVEGVYVFYSPNSSVIDNTLVSNTNHGLYVSSSDNNIVSNNRVLENNDGFHFVSSSYNTVFENVVDSNTGYGIYLYNFYSDTLTNNIANNNSNNGFYLAGSDTIFINNTANNNIENGFYLLGSDCTFINNTANGNSYIGFHLTLSDGNTLVNNTANGNINIGYYLAGSDNVLTNNIANNHSNTGFMVAGSDNTLTNNIANNNIGNGFSLGSDNTFINNTANSNNGNGFFSYSNNILTNNIANNNINSGFYFEGSNNTLTKNNVSGSTYGIYFRYNSVNNRLFYNNVIDNNHGIYIASGSYSNILFKNNLIGSNYNAYDSAGSSSWSKNYYSDYIGIDSNNDSIGDTTYYIAGDSGAKDAYPSMQPYEIGDGANFTLSAGENITLYEGYTLSVQQIDIDGEKAWMAVEKDGTTVYDTVINKGEYVNYIKTVGGSNRLVLQGKLDTVLQSTTTSLVRITNFYQFSEIDSTVLISENTDLPSWEDTTPPILTIISPTNGLNVTTPTITVTGTASDDTSVASVTVNSILATGTTIWSADITLTDGVNVITVLATDATGNSATETVTVTYSAGDPYLVFAITPTSRVAQVGVPVTLFMSMINGGAATATNVTIAQSSSLPANISYQVWDGSTSLIGTPDTPVDMAVAKIVHIALTINATAEFASSPMTFNVSSTNGATAPISGVNTLTISASAAPYADVIMMSTSLDVSTAVNMATAFAIATTNVGEVEATEVSFIVEVPTTISGLAYQVNETNLNGSIKGPAAGLTIPVGGCPTFAVFLTPTQAIDYDPTNNRIVLKLVDGSGKVIGAQSVAVSTT